MTAASQFPGQSSPGHRIVIVGGGAGGLVLATRLRRKHPALNVTLVDASPTHIWKPLLHEIAAGSINPNDDELSYLAHGASCGYEFQLGRLMGLHRANKSIVLAPIIDESGEMIAPERRLHYDTLVLAVGSICNDFGTPGAAEYCLHLDTRLQADRFHRAFLNVFLSAHANKLNGAEQRSIEVTIIGAGATGVELAAELHASVRKLVGYGLNEIAPENVKISLIEAGPRLLPALPEELASAVEQQLRRIGIQLFLNERVNEVKADGVCTASGKFIAGKLKVWAAGIKAPPALADLDGLEVNRLNQIQVRSSLQSLIDDSIFAIGDCSTIAESDIRTPPTAQVANQQAIFLARAIPRYLQGEPLPAFTFKDAGAVVPLSESNTFGVLMGNLLGTQNIRGFIARMAYLWLYRRHQYALYGFAKTSVITLRDQLRRSVGPRLKLH